MKKSLHIIATLFLCIGTACVLYNSINFPDHSYFFKEEYFDPYTNVNVFNGWVNLLYVTNLSLLFTTAVFFLSSAGVLKNSRLLTGNVLVLTACAQFFVMAVYTVMQIAFKGDWGLYALKPAAYHNLGGNLWVHVICPLSTLTYFFFSAKNERSEESEKISLKKCAAVIFSALLIYYIVAKIIGEACFSFKWFPYPIFTPKAIWVALFGGLNGYNPFSAYLLLIISIAVIALLILAAIWLIVKIYNSLQRAEK